MSLRRQILALSMLLALPATGAVAAENSFVASLQGGWSGRGTVLTRIDSKPINVTCSFNIRGGAETLSMDGSCRGLLVVRRSISANLKASGGKYSGTYVGPSGQPSSLSGSQRGNVINLAVRWARLVNGDRSAAMTIERIGKDRLRLQTVDKDPATGKSVVTSRIDLAR